MQTLTDAERESLAFKINAYPGILIPCMPVSKVKATRAETGKEVESAGEKGEEPGIFTFLRVSGPEEPGASG